MLSISTDAAGEVVHIHADLDGLRRLEKAMSMLRSQLERGNCDHDHLFTESWGGVDLTETMLEQESQTGWHQVHHLKVFGWTQEWAHQHGLLGVP